MNEIIVALISGGSALIASIAVAIINNRRSTALIEYRLKKLEEKVDKHNNVIERTFKLEERASVVEEKIKVANNRIDDLEHENKG